MNIKGLLIAIFVFFVIILTVIIFVVAVRKSNNSFDSNKKSAVAVINGKADNSTADNVRFSVVIPELGNNETYNLKGLYNVRKHDGTFNYDYPVFSIGDEVQVEYTTKKTMGITFADVRLNQKAYRKS